MEFVLPRISGTCCFATTFKGEVVDVKDGYFIVTTGLCELKVHWNPFTRISQLGGSFNKYVSFTVKEKQFEMEETRGQLVIGRLVAYPAYKDGQDYHLLCAELTLLGNKQNGPPYMAPNFWLQMLTELGSWWRKYSIDTNYGGYYTNLIEDGTQPKGPNGTDKWSYVISRTLYAFSTVFALTGDKGFLDAARTGAEFLCKHAAFEKNGFRLFHTRMDRQGQLHSEEPDVLNIFTQIYTLTGLTAYYDITRSSTIAELIDGILRTLASLYYDTQHGGFYDAISGFDLKPIPGITDSKSFNSIVDPLSAMLYFLYNSNFQSKYIDLSKTIVELSKLILQRFICHEHNFIREVFRRTWEFQAPNWINPYNTPFEAGNVGGNMKVIWVLLRALDVLPDFLRVAAETAIEHTHSKMISCGAWDALRGGWFEIMQRDSMAGSIAMHMGQPNKVWWQQEEGIVACLLTHLFSRQEMYLDIARDGLAFWLTCFLDGVNGGTFDTVSVDGTPVNRQKGYWLKGGYHETELARFVHIYLSVLKEHPITLYYEYNPERKLGDYRSIPAQIPGLSWQVLDEQLVEDSTVKVRYGFRWKSKTK